MRHTTSLLCIASAIALTIGCRSSLELEPPLEPPTDAGTDADEPTDAGHSPVAPNPSATAAVPTMQGSGVAGAPVPAAAAGSGGSDTAAVGGSGGSSPPKAASGNMPPAPAASMPAAASGNKPPAPDPAAPIDCTRRGLRALIDRYFAALATHDPSSLPISASIKATENCRPTTLGEGVWRSAGKLHFERSAIDPDQCGTVTEALLEVAGAPTVVGIRLKLDDDKLSEVESFVSPTTVSTVALPNLPAGTPAVSTALPGGLMESAAEQWGPAPGARPQMREQLERIADAYLRSSGDSTVAVPFDSPCGQRINGNSTGQTTCIAVTIPSSPWLTVGEPKQRRYPVIDVEAGIAVGFAIMVESYPTPMFAMIKVNDGRIRYIDSVSSTISKTSGWE